MVAPIPKFLLSRDHLATKTTNTGSPSILNRRAPVGDPTSAKDILQGPVSGLLGLLVLDT